MCEPITKPLYVELASRIEAVHNCRKSGNVEWEEKHIARIRECEEYLPHGSGFDNGCSVDVDASTSKRIVIHTSYHHMDEYGGYDGWTDHSVIVTPTFGGIDVRIGGRDRNGIKEYIADTFIVMLESNNYQWRNDPRPEVSSRAARAQEESAE